jgi:hypothetical protein
MIDGGGERREKKRLVLRINNWRPQADLEGSRPVTSKPFTSRVQTNYVQLIERFHIALMGCFPIQHFWKVCHDGKRICGIQDLCAEA